MLAEKLHIVRWPPSSIYNWSIGHISEHECFSLGRLGSQGSKLIWGILRNFWGWWCDAPGASRPFEPNWPGLLRLDKGTTKLGLYKYMYFKFNFFAYFQAYQVIWLNRELPRSSLLAIADFKFTIWKSPFWKFWIMRALEPFLLVVKNKQTNVACQTFSIQI